MPEWFHRLMQAKHDADCEERRIERVSLSPEQYQSLTEYMYPSIFPPLYVIECGQVGITLLGIPVIIGEAY